MNALYASLHATFLNVPFLFNTFHFVTNQSLFLLDHVTVCDTNISLAPVHINLNIPPNHCVQSSIVIRANVLVSLRKQ